MESLLNSTTIEVITHPRLADVGVHATHKEERGHNMRELWCGIFKWSWNTRWMWLSGPSNNVATALISDPPIASFSLLIIRRMSLY